MEITVIKPTNDKLKKHIKFFYVLTHSKQEGPTSYFSFPSLDSMVGFMSNVKSIRKKDFVQLQEASTPNFISELDVSYTTPLCVHYEGNIKEITIVFNTLGINHFLEKPLNSYEKENHQFIPFSDYVEKMEAILKIESNDKAIEQLEEYLLSKLQPKSFYKIGKVITDVIENTEMPLKGIAEKHNISHKTLISYFNKHICKKPSDVRKIIRFRKSLENSENKSLTELSYLSNYFDQAHMIKDFKKLTNHTPKDFFNTISKINNGNINWLLTER